MSKFMSRRFAGLQAYTPGEQPQDKRYVKLNTNASPFPPSPQVIAAVSAAEVEKLNLYPDPEARNPRSTVGTVVEIMDHYRLLFARLGEIRCPKCGKKLKRNQLIK